MKHAEEWIPVFTGMPIILNINIFKHPRAGGDP